MEHNNHNTFVDNMSLQPRYLNFLLMEVMGHTADVEALDIAIEEVLDIAVEKELHNLVPVCDSLRYQILEVS